MTALQLQEAFQRVHQQAEETTRNRTAFEVRRANLVEQLAETERHLTDAAKHEITIWEEEDRTFHAWIAQVTKEHDARKPGFPTEHDAERGSP